MGRVEAWHTMAPGSCALLLGSDALCAGLVAAGSASQGESGCWMETHPPQLAGPKFLSSAAAPETKPWRGFGAPASQKRDVIPGRPSGRPDPGQWNPHAAESTEGNSKGQAGRPRSDAEAGQAAARGPPTCLTLRSTVAGGDGPHTGALTSPGGPRGSSAAGQAAWGPGRRQGLGSARPGAGPSAQGGTGAHWAQLTCDPQLRLGVQRPSR